MIKIGCCGFPVSLKKYVENFSVVELQQTFYQPPEPKTALKWREQVPPDFEFTLKAWQLITHAPSSPTYKKLRQPIPEEKQKCYGLFRPTAEVMAAWEKTKEIASLVKARIIIFQSPASFEPSRENKNNMRQFFSHLERRQFLLGWEARGKWQEEEIQEICQEFNLIDVVDPFERLPQTGGLKYFRLHGLTGYRYRYSDQDLDKIIGWIKEEKEVYVMFNNVYMFDDALRLKESLKEKMKR